MQPVPIVDIVDGAPSLSLFDVLRVDFVALAAVVLDRRVDNVCLFVTLLDVFDCLVVVALCELLVLDLGGELTVVLLSADHSAATLLA